MPRRFRLALFRLLLACSCSGPAGCNLFQPTQPVSYISARSSLEETPVDPNVVQLYQAFLERPAGDPFLDKELWNSTDQNVVDLERQGLLEENGFRIGQLVGIIPDKMLDLIHSPRACLDPRVRTIACGEPANHLLGPVERRGRFLVRQAGQTQEITLEDARCSFDIIASPAKDGRTKLDFVPKVLHRRDSFPVERDDGGWVAKTEKPNRSFPQLSWNVTLASGSFLVIGARLDKPGTLGYRSFVSDEGATPMQRVLILRPNRAINDGAPASEIRQEAMLTRPARMP